MQEKTTRSIYNLWAYVYDRLFWGDIVTRRTSRAIERMEIKQEELVLDIGVGTGLALPAYPEHACVVGIDLSEGMLRKAQERTRDENINHVHLALGNALELPFDDNQFDHVLASHVLTVVSDPVKLIEEIRRVARPGAQVVIINHFRSSNRLVARIEKWVSPICQWLGWKSDVSLQELISKTGLEIEYRYKLDNVDLFETVFAAVKPPLTSAQQAAAV